MNKKIKRLREIQRELDTLAGTLRSENRERTAEETTRYNELVREAGVLSMEIASGRIQRALPMNDRQISEFIEVAREAVRTSRKMDVVIREEGGGDPVPAAPETSSEAIQMTTASNFDAIEPLTVGDVIYPLEEKTIWHLIGARMGTGLSGRYEWPIAGDVEAHFAGEAEDDEAQTIDLDKVSPNQQRVSVGVVISNQAINNSNGKIREIVLNRIPLAVARLINKVVFSPVKLENANINGPFVGKTAKTVATTYKGFCKAKAELLEAGVDPAFMVWSMSAATKAELEGTPKDTGSGVMICENDRIAGLPVFVTKSMGANNIGLGDWRYQCIGQFGQIRLTIDPISKASKDCTVIWLNTDFGTATLLKDAFALYKIA